MQTPTESPQSVLLARLSVIESKLETIINEIAAVRAYIPASMIEHRERICVLERNMRTMQWLAGVFAAAVIGAFVTHVIGG
jgi:hypothetical protein